MTIKEFKSFLDQFPEDMEITQKMCSDFELMPLDQWSIIEAIPPSGRVHIMRYYPNQWKDKPVTKTYLHYEGN